MVDGQNYYRVFAETARRARRYVLLASWQFDSETELLPGSNAAGPTWFLPLLNELCKRNSRLRVCILAWRFSTRWPTRLFTVSATIALART